MILKFVDHEKRQLCTVIMYSTLTHFTLHKHVCGHVVFLVHSFMGLTVNDKPSFVQFEEMKITVPQTDYILGLADLTGLISFSLLGQIKNKVFFIQREKYILIKNN